MRTLNTSHGSLLGMVVLLGAFGCSGGADGSGSSSGAGGQGLATGGQTVATGGTNTSSGGTSSGGTNTSSGGTSTGGTSTSSGGTSSGGTSTGGTASATGGSAGTGGASGVVCGMHLANTACQGNATCTWSEPSAYGNCTCLSGLWGCAQTTVSNCPSGVRPTCGTACDSNYSGCLCTCGGGQNFVGCSCNSSTWQCGGC